MPLDYSALRAEIQTDPSGLGYATFLAKKADGDVARLMGLPFASGQTPIPSINLIDWAGQNGRYAKIVGATLSGDLTLSSVAYSAQKMLDREDTSLDLSLPDRQQMLGALVAYGILSSGDQQSLYNAGLSSFSRGEYLFGKGTVISALDIATALGR